MKCMIVNENRQTRFAERSHAQCVKHSRLADIAAIVSLEELPNGLHMMYQNGVMYQYDPVEGCIVGRHAEPTGRNGWLS